MAKSRPAAFKYQSGQILLRLFEPNPSTKRLFSLFGASILLAAATTLTNFDLKSFIAISNHCSGTLFLIFLRHKGR